LVSLYSKTFVSSKSVRYIPQIDLTQQHSNDTNTNELISKRIILRFFESPGMIVVGDTHLFSEFRRLLLRLIECPEAISINRWNCFRDLQYRMTIDILGSSDVLHPFMHSFLR
jgi:hypothetical protein